MTTGEAPEQNPKEGGGARPHHCHVASKCHKLRTQIGFVVSAEEVGGRRLMEQPAPLPCPERGCSIDSFPAIAVRHSWHPSLLGRHCKKFGRLKDLRGVLENIYFIFAY